MTVVAFWEFSLNNRVDVVAVDSVCNGTDDGGVDNAVVFVVAGDVAVVVVVDVYYRNNNDIDATYSIKRSALSKVSLKSVLKSKNSFFLCSRMVSTKWHS